MSFRLFLTGCCFLTILLGAAGCNKSRLNYNQTITVPAGDIVTLTIDAPKQQQTVKVTISCPNPVDIVVRLANTKGEALATKKGVKDESFEVTIPANENFLITLSSSQETNVSVKVNGL